MSHPDTRAHNSRRGVRWLCGLALAFSLALAGPSSAQTLTDHVMMKKKDFLTGVLYTHDSWDEYWEGGLKRSNGNIGELTTQSVTYYGDYGITDRLNLLFFVPYVWTKASGGTTSGMDDFQDLSIGLKFRMTDQALKWGRLTSYAVVSGGVPITDYTPDLLPLSIGLQSNTLTGRLTVNLKREEGWFGTVSTGYTGREEVTLDRVFYFTNGQAFLTNKMEMPDVMDVTVSAGYQKDQFYIPISFVHQDTRGGGDIRRQDQPYASNNMDWSRVGAAVVYLPKQLKDMMFRFDASHIVSGRNVGQSDTFTFGVFRAIHF